jgi:hypothetical protein
VPKEVKDWTFSWSEGTNAIGLDFEASFVIQANEDVQALKLAKALLRKTDAAGDSLHQLINAALHRELGDMLARCDKQAVSLLDEFRKSTIGVGESEALNRAVTESVRQEIAGVHFRIGFQLKNAPPLQIEVRQTDEFTLADTRLPRKAQTTALLYLDNYQAYKKSGLETETEIKAQIGKAITQAVKHLLFARKYYAVVASFVPGEASISRQMEASIQADARTVGYRVKMFQTFSDIAALKLIEPLRIDIDAQQEKYYLVNSTGYVQMSLAMSAQVADDFSKLHLLIDPDEADIEKPIVAKVRQLCRDTIQRFDRKTFNLGFDDKIVPALEEAIVAGLGSYGLKAEVINLMQVPTEEATRFMAIRGRTIDFSAEIQPRTDDGDGDPVPVVGTIEVTGMTEDGWSQFEGKDFGFRADSLWSESRLRQLADSRDLSVSPPPLLPSDRRTLAVDLELADIRERVVATLEGLMSMGPDLARHWTDWKNNREITEWAQEMAEQAIADEFGLKIALRAFRRLDTEAETTVRVQRNARHIQLREVAKEVARKEIEHQEALRGVINDKQVEKFRRHAQLENQALSDESDPMHETIRQKVMQESERIEAEQRRVGAEAATVLPAKKPPRDPNGQLPWQRGITAKGGGADLPPPEQNAGLPQHPASD